MKRTEPIADGIRRIADEQFSAAEGELRAFRSTEVVHSARKRLKMLRAVLRLVQPGLDRAAFDRENLALRDIGRSLSRQRDADVFVEVIRDLKPSRANDRAFRGVMAHARSHQQKVQRELRKNRALAEARRGVLDAHDRLKEWATSEIDRRAMVKGLRRALKRAERAAGDAARSADDAIWHEWRKRTKDLWYHLRLIRGVWPSVLDGAVAQFKQLADELGDDHDLAMISGQLGTFPSNAATERELARLREAIVRRRAALKKKARDQAKCLLLAKPRAFTDRFEAAWASWRA